MTNNAHENDIADCYGITEASEEISISDFELDENMSPLLKVLRYYRRTPSAWLTASEIGNGNPELMQRDSNHDFAESD
jgi:hypothetical protein